MPTTPGVIPTDLTLEIGENLSADQFLAAVRAFFGLVDQVSETLVPDTTAPWTVVVREGSALIGMEPPSSLDKNVRQLVYSKIENGITHLATGDVEGAALSEGALRHLRTLSELTDRKKAPLPMRVWVRKKPTVIEPAIADSIREDWRTAYSDYGTIEGRLETIQDHGKLEFHVRDVVLRQNVKCYFPEELLDEVFKSFRKRVEVSGLIHYRRNGVPISIMVDSLYPLPEDSELPTPHDVRGILGVT